MADDDKKPVDEKKEDKEEKEEKKTRRGEKKDKKEPTIFEKNTGLFDGKCAECLEKINGSAIICQCGAIFHQYCHDVHVLSKHRPSVKSIDIMPANDAYEWKDSKDLIT